MGEVFFAFLNADGNASRRVYDAHTGRKIGDTESQPGDFTAVFAEDIAIRRYAERANNIVHWSDFETGGHFAALETPELLAGDIRAFFASLAA